ncbi:hypothetical protein ACGFZ9_47295 [Streptomyces mirabilis]|uniref:hypothetical protein n=1 Tax=Streptomyces mirabilis TaxID=68239 RepID=UPI003711451A
MHRTVVPPVLAAAWRERITVFCPPDGSGGAVSGRTDFQGAGVDEAAGTADPSLLEETVLDPEVEMLIETDSDAYALWKALSTVVATHPLAPRPVREDTATVFLSVMDADDLGHRTRVPLAGRRLSKNLLLQQLLAAELPALSEAELAGYGPEPSYMTVSIGRDVGTVPLDTRLVRGLTALTELAAANESGLDGQRGITGQCRHCRGTGQARTIWPPHPVSRPRGPRA